ncbi:MAG: tripartite tricarboxylate transporter substrate binding protein, partial [Limnohabitans sp.]
MKTLQWLPRFLCTSLVVACLSATAQTWPTKPIKLITSSPPGGVVDIYARRHQPHLQNELGQAVMVDNKPGASGAIAGDAAAKA